MTCLRWMNMPVLIWGRVNRALSLSYHFDPSLCNMWHRQISNVSSCSSSVRVILFRTETAKGNGSTMLSSSSWLPWYLPSSSSTTLELAWLFSFLQKKRPTNLRPFSWWTHGCRNGHAWVCLVLKEHLLSVKISVKNAIIWLNEIEILLFNSFSCCFMLSWNIPVAVLEFPWNEWNTFTEL